MPAGWTHMALHAVGNRSAWGRQSCVSHTLRESACEMVCDGRTGRACWWRPAVRRRHGSSTAAWRGAPAAPPHCTGGPHPAARHAASMRQGTHPEGEGPGASGRTGQQVAAGTPLQQRHARTGEDAGAVSARRGERKQYTGVASRSAARYHTRNPHLRSSSTVHRSSQHAWRRPPA